MYSAVTYMISKIYVQIVWLIVAVAIGKMDLLRKIN